MRVSRLLTALCAIICCAPAFAWSYRGHRVVAYIAYERLTPQTRARVDELIRKHSDYETILTKGAPTDPAGRARYAFLTAAAWPDMIRNDPRTYDETRADASPPLYPTSILDPRRHPTWHYYDIPLSGDGTPGKFSPPPNALTELDRLIPEMAATKDDALAAYDLLWVEHLVGDVHQPLHAVSRYLDSQPTGDAGGNYVYFEGNRTLHGIWDDAGGLLPYTAQDSPDDADTIRLAHELTAEYPEPPGLSLTPKDWINESFALDKSDVYTFGPVAGTKEAPLKVQPGYLENVKKVSRRRMAMAGYRLAAVLNRELH